MKFELPWRPDDSDNTHAIKDVKKPDKETPYFGSWKVNETWEIIESILFVDEVKISEFIFNPSTWNVKQQRPYHGQKDKNWRPSWKEKHPKPICNVVLDLVTKFQPDMLGFDSASMQQMYSS